MSSIEIPEICPVHHRKNNISPFHYTFCIQCQNVFLESFVICPECRSEDVIRKELDPYWMLDLGSAIIIDFKISMQLAFNPDEDDPEFTRQTYKFPRNSWEYLFVSSNCFGPNDVLWWMK